jgi:hypothetical protein
MSVKRITFADNIRAEVGKSSVFLNGHTGEVSFHVTNSQGSTASMTVYTKFQDAASRAEALVRVRDMYTAIGELLAEIDARGLRP